MAYWNLISKTSNSNGTKVCAGFIVKLKKQLPLLWNIVWQNLKALVQGAAERDCRLDMIVNKKLHVILKSRFLLLCQFFLFMCQI